MVQKNEKNEKNEKNSFLLFEVWCLELWPT